ncbi:MAG: AAA family ATPase, partial [Planctomycetota bacterium]
MKIRSLKITRLPGIRDPFEISDLSPGLNLIIGPNASGKTSLCRAFRSLIWPEGKRMDHASLSSELVAGDGEFRVEREGNTTRWVAGEKSVE